MRKETRVRVAESVKGGGKSVISRLENSLHFRSASGSNIRLTDPCIYALLSFGARPVRGALIPIDTRPIHGALMMRY